MASLRFPTRPPHSLGLRNSYNGSFPPCDISLLLLSLLNANGHINSARFFVSHRHFVDYTYTVHVTKLCSCRSIPLLYLKNWRSTIEDGDTSSKSVRV